MVTKRNTRAGKKVKNLKARSLSARKAKGVKGGLLPAVKTAQKVQYAMGDGSVRFVR